MVAPARMAPAHDHHHPVDVVEGQDADQHLCVRQLLDRMRLAQVGDQVVVGQHDPFREPGRSARVGQDDQIRLRVDVDVGRRAVALGQRGERRGPFRFAEHEHFLHRGAGRGFLRFVEELRDGHQELCSGADQLSLQLARGIQRVDRCVDAAGGGHTEERDGVLRHVRAVDGEHIALAEPARRQPGRRPLDRPDQLSIGQGASARSVDERRLVGVFRRVLEQIVLQRDVRDVHVRIGAAIDHRPLREYVSAVRERACAPRKAAERALQ